MGLSIQKTKYNFKFNNYTLSAETERAEKKLDVIFQVNGEKVYIQSYTLNDVQELSDTQIINKAAKELLIAIPTDNKYTDIIRNHYKEIKLINKDVFFLSEYCGMEFWINITISHSKYDINYKNMSTGDIISFGITADNFTDLTEKIRVYLKDITDTNQLFAAHVEQLSRNEYIDYSEA